MMEHDNQRQKSKYEERLDELQKTSIFKRAIRIARKYEFAISVTSLEYDEFVAFKMRATGSTIVEIRATKNSKMEISGSSFHGSDITSVTKLMDALQQVLLIKDAIESDIEDI